MQALNIGLPVLLLAPLLHDCVSCCSPQQLIPAVVGAFGRRALLCVSSNPSEVLSLAAAQGTAHVSLLQARTQRSKLRIEPPSHRHLSKRCMSPAAVSGPAGLNCGRYLPVLHLSDTDLLAKQVDALVECQLASLQLVPLRSSLSLTLLQQPARS